MSDSGIEWFIGFVIAILGTIFTGMTLEAFFMASPFGQGVMFTIYFISLMVLGKKGVESLD